MGTSQSQHENLLNDNIDSLKHHVKQQTVTQQYVDDVLNETIGCIYWVPDEFLSDEHRMRFLRKRNSFRYIEPDVMTFDFVTKFFDKFSEKKSSSEVQETLMCNLRYFPSSLFTVRFVNFMFDIVRKNLRSKLTGMESVSHGRSVSLVFGYSHSITTYNNGRAHVIDAMLEKVKIVESIPDVAFDRQMIDCIVGEDVALRSRIKPEILAAF
jgi:hypothetical protein